ncbi:hypothetical protein HMPREF0673_01399 [Leyella stercorea DSM 18206]|uniref:Uncharacterized protein n=1 Tax=Leyella stercorea DSM 18206 TaxID=1002367 RepID=G6AXP3_9BACT|nr:hypothetical protein HMPREF0673_01399 [Leyella stercorea DSM 18206]
MLWHDTTLYIVDNVDNTGNRLIYNNKLSTPVVKKDVERWCLDSDLI